MPEVLVDTFGPGPLSEIRQLGNQKQLLSLDFTLRDRVLLKLALYTGARPGELLALKREHVHDKHFVILQRLYRGKIDTPKTPKSKRTVAIPLGVQADLKTWLEINTGS
jgi:integrase